MKQIKYLFSLIMVIIVAAFSCSEDIFLEGGKDGFSTLLFIDEITQTKIYYLDRDHTFSFTPEDSVLYQIVDEEYKFVPEENGCFELLHVVGINEFSLGIVCSGEDGKDGEDGIDGQDGEDGKSTVVVFDIVEDQTGECKSGRRIVWRSFLGDEMVSQVSFCVPADGEDGEDGKSNSLFAEFIKSDTCSGGKKLVITNFVEGQEPIVSETCLESGEPEKFKGLITYRLSYDFNVGHSGDDRERGVIFENLSTGENMLNGIRNNADSGYVVFQEFPGDAFLVGVDYWIGQKLPHIIVFEGLKGIDELGTEVWEEFHTIISQENNHFDRDDRETFNKRASHLLNWEFSKNKKFSKVRIIFKKVGRVSYPYGHSGQYLDDLGFILAAPIEQ